MTLPAPSSAGLWLDLETLLDLPLEPQSLAVVWQEILQQQHWGSSPAEQLIRQRLVDALQNLDLERAIARCEQGEWSTGLSKLEAHLRHDRLDKSLAQRLVILLPMLHFQLVELAEQSPSRCPFDESERAELLWTCSIWLKRLDAFSMEHPGCLAQSERMAVIHEHIYRYGALVWMQRESSLACTRSLTLLLDLSAINPLAIPWAMPACIQRIQQELETLEALVTMLQPSPELLTHVERLIGIAKRLEEVFPAAPPAPELRLQQQLVDVRACLDVWGQLRLP